MDREVSLLSKSPEDTINFGIRFAQKGLPPGAVAVLRGELGAGKTQFTKGIARFFGLDGNEISSPTYALVNEYDISSEGITKLFHLDCYRFEKPEELIELGIEEYLYPKDGVTIIEWPERIEDYLPANRIEVIFDVLSQDERRILIKSF